MSGLEVVVERVISPPTIILTGRDVTLHISHGNLATDAGAQVFTIKPPGAANLVTG